MKIGVKVKPRSKQVRVIRLTADSFVVHLKSVPEKNRANWELIKVMADYFQITQSQVRIVHGSHSQHKIVEITGIEINLSE